MIIRVHGSNNVSRCLRKTGNTQTLVHQAHEPTSMHQNGTTGSRGGSFNLGPDLFAYPQDQLQDTTSALQQKVEEYDHLFDDVEKMQHQHEDVEKRRFGGDGYHARNRSHTAYRLHKGRMRRGWACGCRFWHSYFHGDHIWVSLFSRPTFRFI